MRKFLFWRNNAEYFKALLLLMNAFLVFASILVALYLVAPLFGGEFSARAVIVYASWIGLALVTKVFLRRIQKRQRIKAHEYALACLFVIVYPLLQFRYPMGIIFSLLCIGGFGLAYRARESKEGRKY